MSKRRDLKQELNNLDEMGLSARLLELREKGRNLQFQTKGDEIRDLHQYAKLKKEIAITLTILAEKRKINNQ